METLKNYVNWKLAHSDKVADAEGYPLVMENCKPGKSMKELEIYGNCYQATTGKNLFDIDNMTVYSGHSSYSIENGVLTVSQTSTGTYQSKNIAIDENLIGKQIVIYALAKTLGDNTACMRVAWFNGDRQVKNLSIITKQYSGTDVAAISATGVITEKPEAYPNAKLCIAFYSNGNAKLESTGDYSAEYSNIQLEIGSSVTPYEPYIQKPTPDYPSEIQSVGDLITDTESEYYGKYKIPIVVRGKNLLDDSFLSKISSITYQDGWYQGSAYSFLDYTTKNKNISGIFKPNTQYTFSWTVNSLATNLHFLVYYTDGTITRLATAVSTNTDLYLTGTSSIGKSIDYVLIDYGGNNTCKIKNLQIEEGIIATEYESYVEPITQNIYLDEPLRKIEDYADYINFKNKKVYRNIFSNSLNIHHIYKKVTDVVRFDGYKSSTLRTIPNSIILSYIFPYKKSDLIANRESIFNHSTSAINWYWSIFWNRLGLTYDGTNVYRTDDTEQTPLADSEIISIANEWIATLSDRDKTIYRVRETPIEEDISCQLPKTLAKTTVIEVETTLKPSNLKGKYIIK